MRKNERMTILQKLLDREFNKKFKEKTIEKYERGKK